VLEKEEVVVDQGGRYDDDDEYEGSRGPAFTPPTKPCTGNHGATGGFDHGPSKSGLKPHGSVIFFCCLFLLRVRI
jgi:hypothetical protein